MAHTNSAPGGIVPGRPVVFATRRGSLAQLVPPPEFEVLMSIHEQAIGRVRLASLDAFIDRDGDEHRKQHWIRAAAARNGSSDTTAHGDALAVRSSVLDWSHGGYGAGVGHTYNGC